MKKTKIFTKKEILKIAKLSNIPLDNKESSYISSQFNKTLETVNVINELKTESEGTNSVTGLKNVFREDKVDKKRILSKEQALSNSKRTLNGFFVVKGIIDEK